MEQFLGIDLGTQGVKVAGWDEEGNFLGSTSREYPIITPQTGFAEQNPETWWEKTKEAIRELVSSIPQVNVKAIGFSGQMHGTVIIDENLEPLCPAIIWVDQRSHKEVKIIREKLKDKLAIICGSDVSTGFMAPTLLWLKENQREIFSQVRWAILPKDYLKIKMGLAPSTDVADASSTLLFNIRRRNWSEEILEILGLNRDIFPPVYESSQIIGQMKEEVKEELGLKGEVLLVAGAGDQHCAALGNGITEEGELLVTIGTGGQVFAPLSKPLVDEKLRIHTFCHALPGFWHLLGATLCAGLSLSWFKKSVLDSPLQAFDFKELDQEAQKVEPGSQGLLFLPYLIGERTPYMDPRARGAFLNLHLTHGRAHFIRAIMEGVSLGLKNVIDVFKELGVDPQRVVFSGGGAKSALWRKIMASVLDTPLFITQVKEEAATGACLLAMMGTAQNSSWEETILKIVSYRNPIFPERQAAETYAQLYPKFKEAYPALKHLFP